ncbi:hypothetical protein SKB08_14450, partial [Enterococcus faecium]
NSVVNILLSNSYTSFSFTSLVVVEIQQRAIPPAMAKFPDNCSLQKEDNQLLNKKNIHDECTFIGLNCLEVTESSSVNWHYLYTDFWRVRTHNIETSAAIQTMSL